jgi:hypothetical protein
VVDLEDVMVVEVEQVDIENLQELLLVVIQ